MPEEEEPLSPTNHNNNQRLSARPPHTGRVNHVSVELAQEAPEVMLGTFNINCIPATVLFDSGASHSFILQAFVRVLSIALCAMKNSGGSMPANYWRPSTSVSLRRVEFKVNPTVLRTSGIDLILGVDWMKQHRVVIQCQEKSAVVKSPKGDRICVEVAVQAPLTATVKQMTDEVNEENQVVDDFPDELPGMPPDRDIEFLTKLLPRTTPIAKRPYRMAENELGT